MDSPHTQLRHIAQSQGGVVTRGQVLAVGITDRQIKRHVDEGAWLRLGSGAYSLFGAPSIASLLAGATASLPATASHEAAGYLHGLVGIRNKPVVTIPHRLSNRFPGVEVHESTDLAEEHITEVDGIPTTTIPRTLFDLGGGRSLRTMRRMAERAIVSRKTTLWELETILGEIGRRGRPGTTRFRELMAALSATARPPESELERRMLELLANAQLPRPDLQADLPWRASVAGRVDLLYRAARLIIECDGRQWHSTSDAFQRDRRRDNLAQLDGWLVLRFTWDDVTTRGHEVVAQIRRALRIRQVA